MMVRTIAGNTLLNFGGQVSLAAMALLAMPVLVSRLGTEEFGLLSILWLFVGYFGFLDLGIGQAAGKYISELVARNDRESAGDTLRTTLRVSGVLALSMSVTVALLGLGGIERFLSISTALQSGARSSVIILAIGIPAVVLQSALRSVPLAFKRFDLLNLAQFAGGTVQWGGAVIACLLGGGISQVILLMVCGRYVSMLLLAGLTVKLLPECLRGHGGGRGVRSSTLLNYGGWALVSQAIAPLLTLFERLLLGTALSLSWVTFFSVPNDVVIRLLIFPLSLVSTLFPIFSGGGISEERMAEVKSVFQRAAKLVYLGMLPIVLVLAVYGREILQIWLGAEYAARSGEVISILAVGLLFNAIAQLPMTALQAFGRPDLPAKVSLVQLPLYIGLFYLLTTKFGIEGSACAWLTRVVAEAGTLWYLYRRFTFAFHPAVDRAYFYRSGILLLFTALALVGGRIWLSGIPAHVVAILSVTVLYALGVWRIAFDPIDRGIVSRYLPVLNPSRK